MLFGQAEMQMLPEIAKLGNAGVVYALIGLIIFIIRSHTGAYQSLILEVSKLTVAIIELKSDLKMITKLARRQRIIDKTDESDIPNG